MVSLIGCAPHTNFANKLHDRGYSGAVVGMSAKQISNILMTEVTEELWSPPEEKYYCYYIYPNNIGEDLHIMISEEKAIRFEVRSSKLETVIGVKVGDTEESVLKKLHGNIKVGNHPYEEEGGKYILLKTNDNYGFLVETRNKVVTEIRSGDLSAIQFIEGCL